MCLSGRKRARDFEDDDYWAELESLRPRRKRRKIEKVSDTSLAHSPARKQIRLKRSNSLDHTGGLLSIADRHPQQTALKTEDVKDYSVVAVFSREAFENFGKKWKATMSGDSLSQATKSSKLRVDPDEASTLLGLQSKVVVGTDFEAQLQALLEGKTNPHVIAVIEGKQEVESVSLKVQVDGQTIEAPYTRVHYLQGTNAQGSPDNKQSMSVYVRNDMKGAYTVTEEKIRHKSGKLIPEFIPALGVNYETEDGTSYRTLVVHIPNKFVGSQEQNSDTHASFEQYAADELLKSKVVVTTYVGDTNYKTPMREFSVASMGGHSSTGETLNPQGSGAQRETHFMQSVPLGADGGKHSVRQPSTLNYPFINRDSANPEVTDHPSIEQFAAHLWKIKGRQGESAIDFLH